MSQSSVVVVSSIGVSQDCVDVTIARLVEDGFLITEKAHMLLSEEQALVFADKRAKAQYTAGPVVALLVEKEDAFASLERLSPELDYVYFSENEYTALRDESALFDSRGALQDLQRTLAVLKPGWAEQDVLEVEALLHSNHFVTVAKRVCTLTRELADRVFEHQSEEHQAYVTSGDCACYVLERVGAVDAWKLIVGPSDPEVAQECAPNTLRAKYGQNAVQNGVHASESWERATVEVAALFEAPFPITRTLALLTPDIASNEAAVDRVMDAIRLYEFTVVRKDTFYLSKARAQELYAPLRGGEEGGGRSNVDEDVDVDAMVNLACSGPVIAIALAKPAAVASWAAVAGTTSPAEARKSHPQSLRAVLGGDAIRAGVHASASDEDALREIRFFFPQLPLDDIPDREQVEMYMQSSSTPHTDSLHTTLVAGLTELCRAKPVGLDAVRWLANWLLQHNPNKPRVDVSAEGSAAVVDALGDDEDDDDGDAASAGSGKTIVFAHGTPGSEHMAACRLISQKLSYEIVAIDEVVRSGQDVSLDHGQEVRQCLARGMACPAHIVVDLLEAVIRKSKSSKFLILGFPSTLDEALTFTKQVCAPKTVLFFDCEEATSVRRLGGRKNEAKVRQRLQAFYDSIMPVLDHFRDFGKVSAVACDQDDAEAVFAQAKGVLS